MKLSVAHTVSSIENLAAGPSYSVTGLARAQARLGANVSVLSLGSNNEKKEEAFTDLRFRNALSNIPVLNKLGASPDMQRVLRNSPPEIVHTHGLWMLPNIYCPPEAAFVIAPRGMLTPVALGFSPGKKRLFRLLFQDQAFSAAALFHATAESEYDDIRRLDLRQPVAIIPNGIDIPTLAPVQESGKTVLSLGRIHPKKGLDTLIQAWATIEAAFPDWRLKIAGPDERGHVRELEVLVRKLGLNSVSIEPPIFGTDKVAMMAKADLFALSSHSENFGMTVAESLAAGVPVISTKGAPWSGLETHRCGWWIDHGPESLAATLHTALSLPEAERRTMGARGRDWMARDFSWGRMAEMSLQAYAWILGRGDRPSFVFKT
ncbi:glycosyltransferase [Pseudosulfitobacter pseudonitzschiae]|uniref:glycosyltransferase n=1 Tax=Pseudosulfitobacter pseudonitzschiae TaxID=1402135 RepID=UPI003B767B88